MKEFMKKLKMLSFMLACALFNSQTYSATDDSNSKETKELVEYTIGCIVNLKCKVCNAGDIHLKNPKYLASHEEFMRYITSFVEQNKDSIKKLKAYRKADIISTLVIRPIALIPTLMTLIPLIDTNAYQLSIHTHMITKKQWCLLFSVIPLSILAFVTEKIITSTIR